MTTAKRPPIGRIEFIALAAMMFATIAFSIDSMLPALPEIAQELSPLEPNRAQLILTSFVLGMGLGTFFTGPLSDSFGRKSVITVGALIYCGAAFVAWMSTSLEVMLAARLIQGIGAAGPRVVTLAVIRDLYSGRDMARTMSFVMMVFTLVPAIAPLMGAGIIAFAGWRGIFVAFMLFSLLSVLWMQARLPETLPRAQRRAFAPRALMQATRELFSYTTVRVSIGAQSLCFAMLFTMISVIQPVYDVTFDKADSFPFWFGAIAVLAGTSSLLNAALVMQFGMRKLVSITLLVQVVLSGIAALASTLPLALPVLFVIFLIWQASVFFQAGMTIGNLNALAMEPVGHIAGLAASIIGGVATVIGAALAMPVGLLFDGSPFPLAAAICLEAAAALALMLWLRRIEAREAGAAA